MFKSAETKRILAERQAFYVHHVSKQSGWSLDEAMAKMDELASRGVNYRFYAKQRLWTKSGERLDKSIAYINKVRISEKKGRKRYIKLVSEQSGWRKIKVKKEIFKANLYTGCTFRDYYQFEFWNKTTDEQMKYYTKGVAEQLMMKYNNNTEELRILKNKSLFAEKFYDLFLRVSFVNRKISFGEFVEKLKNVEDIISKPAFGSHGAGVEKHHIPEDMDGKRVLYDNLMDKPRSQCEEFIKQHHSIAEFCDKSVNTIRVMTILDNGICHYMYSVIRLGTGGLIDGFDEGGIFAPIDVETGITCRDALNLENQSFPNHPVSGKETNNFQVPYWDEVRCLTETAAKRLEGVHMVGWDVAITETGPCLIEGNSEANYQFAQLPYIKEGLGMKWKFEPFLQ